MDVFHEEPGIPQMHGKRFMTLVKPCKCTFYCWCRPEMVVHHMEEVDKMGNPIDEIIGKIKLPF